MADTLPLGGRTSSMGGAMAAFGHDSACPYLNPAGLVLVPGNILSLSTSIYTRNSYTIKNFYIPKGVDTGTVEFGNTYNYDQQSLTSANIVGFPGALCYKLNLNKDNVVGISVMVPEYDRRTFDGNLSLTFPNAATGPVEFNISDTYIMERTEYYIGPSYALGFGRIRIGISLFLLYRTVLNSVEATSLNTVYDGATPTYPASRTTGYAKGVTYGFAPIAGMQVEIVNNLYAGITLTSPVLHIAGSFEGSGRYNESEPLDPPGDYTSITKEDGNIKYNKPFKARVGLGYEVKKSWSVALDAEYVLGSKATTESDITDTTTVYQQGDQATTEKTNIKYKGETKGAFNLYAGGEYYINDNWVLRMGFFMMPTTNKLEESQDDVLTLAIDRYGASIGVGNETDAGETTVGITFVYGKGRTVAGDVFSDLGTANYQYVDVSNFIIALSISGTVDFTKP